MTDPHFAMMWPSLRGRHVIRWKLYLTAASVSEESLLCLLLFVMTKDAYLSDFDRVQTSMAWWIRSISETARLVGCTRRIVVSTYTKG